jgi:hypothetical protein
MSRRPASVTQADVTRVLRAAQQAGPNWRVEIEGKVVRLLQGPPSSDTPPEPPTPENPLAPEERWRL